VPAAQQHPPRRRRRNVTIALHKNNHSLLKSVVGMVVFTQHWSAPSPLVADGHWREWRQALTLPSDSLSPCPTTVCVSRSSIQHAAGNEVDGARGGLFFTHSPLSMGLVKYDFVYFSLMFQLSTYTPLGTFYNPFPPPAPTGQGHAPVAGCRLARGGPGGVVPVTPG